VLTPDPVPADLAGLDDHDLLAGGLADAVAAWRAEAPRWARLVEFHRRREADHRARRAADPHFALTPRQATALEVSELWGWSEAHTRHQLNVALFLSARMPQLWAWCLAGQLDPYLATTIADQARHLLGNELDHLRLGERLSVFLAKRLRDHDGMAVPVVGVSAKQVRNKLTYKINRLRSRDAEERFRHRYDDRGVRQVDTEDGMATLTIASSVDQVQRAEHRLTLAAKQRRAAGDPRTVAQLKADLAIDLLVGRVDGRSEGGAVPVPTFARPIINVTVPIQTLLGIADDPATLSGGRVIPAGLARRIAAEPGATWYRMLTNEAGQLLALSTRSYTPTAPIWRQMVAEQTSCYRPNCDRPATGCELDHRTPGRTAPPAPPTSSPPARPTTRPNTRRGSRWSRPRPDPWCCTRPRDCATPASPPSTPPAPTGPRSPRFSSPRLNSSSPSTRSRTAATSARPNASPWSGNTPSTTRSNSSSASERTARVGRGAACGFAPTSARDSPRQRSAHLGANEQALRREAGDEVGHLIADHGQFLVPLLGDLLVGLPGEDV